MRASHFPSLSSTVNGSGLSDAGDHFGCVAAEVWRGGDAFQFLADHRLPDCIIAPPGLEGRTHTGCCLWVDGVQLDQPISQQCIARSVLGVKTCVVRGETAQGRTERVRVFLPT